MASNHCMAAALTQQKIRCHGGEHKLSSSQLASMPLANGIVFDRCWSRMYVLILIGGGILGVLQVPDTRLHVPLSRRYQDLVMQELKAQGATSLESCGLPLSVSRVLLP
mgnify:CR=1 FL=1